MDDQKDIFISFCNSHYGMSGEEDHLASCARSKTVTTVSSPIYRKSIDRPPYNFICIRKRPS